MPTDSALFAVVLARSEGDVWVVGRVEMLHRLQGGHHLRAAERWTGGANSSKEHLSEITRIEDVPVLSRGMALASRASDP